MSWFRRSPPPPPTDLFGNPLQKRLPFDLSLWQKRQAVLLLRWTSDDYLQGLKSLIEGLIKGSDINLMLAESQGRDALLTNERWGVRDASTNWSTYVRSALQDFHLATLKLLAWRDQKMFGLTGATQCGRMIDEHSSLWMTPDEEAQFNASWRQLYAYASKLDDVVSPSRNLNDLSFAAEWRELSDSFRRSPHVKLVVNTSVEARTGQQPPVPGVYVPQDDPLGALQFGWPGSEDGALRSCLTLNPLGRELVSAVGRQALWHDGQKIALFASTMAKKGRITDWGVFEPGDAHDPRWAPALLALNTFESRPCAWYLVEAVASQHEPLDDNDESNFGERLRCPAGQMCPREGEWDTPAKVNSRRHFKQGEVMPSVGADYGQTIWHWAGESNA